MESESILKLLLHIGSYTGDFQYVFTNGWKLSVGKFENFPGRDSKIHAGKPQSCIRGKSFIKILLTLLLITKFLLFLIGWGATIWV